MSGFSAPYSTLSNGSTSLALNADGSIAMVVGTAAKGFAATGTAPSSIAGAGTAGGTFWSVTAPNGGASTGAAGGTGSGIAWTSGNAGASNSGGAYGGDIVVNLGAGTGASTADSRSGQFQIVATDVGTPNTQYNAALMVTQTLSPTGVILANRQACSFLLTSNGAGANLGGGSSVGVSAIESRHISNFTGTVAPLLYGAEFQFIHNGTGTITSATAVQGDVSATAGNSGTITSGVSFRSYIGPFLSATCTTAIGFEMAQLQFGTAVATVVGFRNSNIWASNNGTDTVGTYNVYGALLAVPSQGGNTSGTVNNIGVAASYAWLAGAGGGVPGTGGTTHNWAVYVEVPNANGIAGVTAIRNAGIYIVNNGGTGTNTLSYAIRSDSTAASVFQGPMTIGSTTIGTASSLQIADGWNIDCGTSTGMIIGVGSTRKIGFFNATPVVRPAASADVTGFVAGVGTASKSDSTWTGASGASAYTVGGIVTALKALGLLTA